jgi:RimJ/RimL family protein N-acetyltransferase
MIRIRDIAESDAAALVELHRSLDRESTFMLWEPGERKTGAEELAQRIRGIVAHENQNIFVAEDRDRLVGFLLAQGWNARRASRRLYIVIGIAKSGTKKESLFVDGSFVDEYQMAKLL